MALGSSSRGGAVAIGGVGSRRAAGHQPHHGDGGLSWVLEHVDGLDLAAAWKESKGFALA